MKEVKTGRLWEVEPDKFIERIHDGKFYMYWYKNPILKTSAEEWNSMPEALEAFNNDSVTWELSHA